MTAATSHNAAFMDRLPVVQGRYLLAEPLAKYTWFKVGGPAEVLFVPKDADDLCHFLASLPMDISVMPLGVGSNLLVRDGGVSGVVIRLGKAFGDIVVDQQDIYCGAGATDDGDDGV